VQVDSSTSDFSPLVQRIAPMGQKNLEMPTSTQNTGVHALHMLPVYIIKTHFLLKKAMPELIEINNEKVQKLIIHLTKNQTTLYVIKSKLLKTIFST